MSPRPPALIRAAAAALLLLVTLTGGCRTPGPLPPADLRQPGWRVQQGQAIWTARRGAEGVSGELLLATRPDGACFVQFAKPPFTLATARAEAGAWSVAFPAPRPALSGRGHGPDSFVWFALSRAQQGQPLRGGWQFSRRAPEGWRLVNAGSGESLEGYLSP